MAKTKNKRVRSNIFALLTFGIITSIPNIYMYMFQKSTTNAQKKRGGKNNVQSVCIVCVGMCKVYYLTLFTLHTSLSSYALSPPTIPPYTVILTLSSYTFLTEHINSTIFFWFFWLTC